jgi:hypothetical protein
MDATVHLGPETAVSHSFLRHTTVGRGCRIINSVIEGHPAWPVIMDHDVTLINCHVRSTGEKNAFAFCGSHVDQRHTHLGPRVFFSNSRICNAVVDEGSQGFGASIEYSHIGPYNNLRNSSNITCAVTAAACNLGSEVSKTLVLGPGFVSEHGSSYLSLLAPTAYPILTADKRERVLDGLPNVTNIGAGTVFANYGGEPLPAATLADSPGSAKGTALVYSAFVCINCRVINRYGQPEGQPSPFDLLRRRDLTILGFGSFVENKLTGRIPAFSYAGDLSPRSHKLGWVLAQHPGIILRCITRMQSLLGDQAGRLQDLVEGTLRLECEILQAELDGTRPTFYSRAQLQDGLAIFQAHLDDGRWAMDDAGNWRHPWGFDPGQQQWDCHLGGDLGVQGESPLQRGKALSGASTPGGGDA